MPFISKATGWSLADIGTLAMLGVSLPEQGITELCPADRERLLCQGSGLQLLQALGLDAYLSPEMKSTGEAIGSDKTINRALYKALQASGMRVATPEPCS